VRCPHPAGCPATHFTRFTLILSSSGHDLCDVTTAAQNVPKMSKNAFAMPWCPATLRVPIHRDGNKPAGGGANGLNQSRAGVGTGGHNNIGHNPVFRGMVGARRAPAFNQRKHCVKHWH
jgi:hypothetical protein